MTPPTGRATYHHFPYFNMQYGNGGVMIAIGWSAMWKADFRLCAENDVHFTAGQKQLVTYLKPGEKIRTPPWRRFWNMMCAGTTITLQISWRHWFLDCNMQKIAGKLFEPNVSGAPPGRIMR